MPRRLPASHDDLRAAAVASARRAVAAGGLPALNARAVAAEIGCSVGSLYNLFVDLDDLVLHVAATVLDDMAEALFASGLPADPAAALVEIGRRYVRFAAANGALWAMVFEHRPTHARPTPEWQSARIMRLKEGVRAVAGSALATGGEAELSLDVLWASVHGIAALSQQEKLTFVTSTDAEALAERLVRTHLAGLAAAA